MVYITCKHEMEMNNMIAYEGKVFRRKVLQTRACCDKKEINIRGHIEPESSEKFI